MKSSKQLRELQLMVKDVMEMFKCNSDNKFKLLKKKFLEKYDK